jgi:hypothetical protein
MKRNIFIIIGCLFLLASALKGQDYYYSDNRKIHFEKANHWIVIQVAGDDRPGFEQIVAQIGALGIKQALKPDRGIYWLKTNKETPVQTALSELEKRVKIIRTIPVYFSANTKGDTTRFIVSDEFRVKFHHHVTRAEIETMNAKYGVEILNSNRQNEYTLRVTEKSPFSTLEIANIYYESDLTIWSLPDFLADIRPGGIDDPLFPNQWHLKNTGQGGGSSDVDIDAEQAWNLTTGSSNIIIAIIDGGVEDHEDFHTGQLVEGYTARIGGDGSPVPYNTDWSRHGQCVAGIAVAAFNTIGVRGVTDNVKIMPIRIGDIDGLEWSDIAAAIDTAWTRGADILNNSWWVDNQGFYNDDVAQAFSRALTQGRSGKGCLIVAIGGNSGSFTAFPGTISGLLTVGAVTNQNNPASYTPRDWGVDVVAPSGGGTLGITTMDRMGSLGYSFGNYHNNFSGTSAAAPQVSGIGALILSLNPDWEARLVGPNPNPQVQNTIKLSADDYGNTNWDGYGRINANKAVRNLYVPQVYSTISSALNAASSGQTVIVASGTYNENSHLNVSSGRALNLKPNVTLNFSGSYKLNVFGSLFSLGTSGYPNPKFPKRLKVWRRPLFPGNSNCIRLFQIHLIP